MNLKFVRIIDTYAGIPLMYCASLLRRLSGKPAVSGLPRNPAAILCVKFWGVGNLFMMLPAVEALKRHYPQAAIDLLTLRTSRDAAATTGMFATLHTIDTDSLVTFLFSTAQCLVGLRQRKYNLVIDFEQFAKFSALLCSLTGAGETIGYDTADQQRHFLYSKTVAYDNTVHITRSYFALAVAAGVTCDGDDPLRSFCWTPSAQALPQSVRERLGIPDGRQVIAMHVGTSDNFKERRWPAEYYAALADLLVSRHQRIVVLTGLPEEAPLAARVLQAVHRRDGVVDASGRLGFHEFLELLAESELVISSDTAPVHMASAMAVPVVGLYGPNTPRLYGPWRQSGVACTRSFSCSPCITNFNAKTHDCRHPDCKGSCMTALLPDEVYRAVKEKYLDHQAEEGRDPCIIG
jgi:ADP-heptose:LPS heptosyltransferase